MLNVHLIAKYNAPSGDRTVVCLSPIKMETVWIKNVTLVLRVAPNLRIGHPYESFRSETCSGVRWVITYDHHQHRQRKVWNSEANRIMPLVDGASVSCFTHGDITMVASFVPVQGGKSPVIWLHGGEGVPTR